MKKEKEIKDSKNLKIITNGLNNESFDLDELLGITCMLLYDKNIFPKNKDIEPFLNEVFGISFLDYVFKSRTLIVARLTKYIYLENNERINDIQMKIINFLKQKNQDKVKKKVKKNANTQLESWLKGL